MTAMTHMETLRARAETGDIDGMLGLAGVIASSNGRLDEREAITWTIQAAVSGSVAALRSLGFLGATHGPDENFVAWSAKLLAHAAFMSDAVALDLVEPVENAEVANLEPLRAAEGQFWAAFNSSRDGRDASLASVSDQPRIRLAKGFMSEFECRYVCAAASPRLDSARIFSSKVKKSIVDAEVRSADVSSCPPEQLDIVFSAIAARAARLLKSDLVHSDHVQVVRYRPGGKFLAHMDTSEEESLAVTGESFRRRRISFIAYLNDDYVGGETAFIEPRLKVAGARGDALYFYNLTDDGELDKSTMHAGVPVTEGEKWIWVQWFRENGVRKLRPEIGEGAVVGAAQENGSSFFVKDRSLIRGVYGRSGRVRKEACLDWHRSAARTDCYGARPFESPIDVIMNEQAAVAEHQSGDANIGTGIHD